MKVAFQEPLALATILEATGFPSKVTLMPVSLAAKPVPVMVIELPGVPLDLLTVIIAAVLKLAPAAVLVTLPDAETVCEPADDVGTVNEALQEPLLSAMISEATALPSKIILIPASLAPKPEPVTVTEVPGVPLVLLSDTPAPMLKPTGVTEEAVVTEPEAETLCAPDATDGTVNVVLQEPTVFAEMVPESTGLPSKITLIPVSLALNPTPFTVTEVPGAPLFCLREMAGLVLKVTLVTEPVTVESP